MKYGPQPHPAIANANEARRVEREAERRDVFARAALTGMLANGEWHTPSSTAQRAYEFADAMLAARGEK